MPVMHQVGSKGDEQALAYDQEVDETGGYPMPESPEPYALDMDQSSCTISYTSCVLCNVCPRHHISLSVETDHIGMAS